MNKVNMLNNISQIEPSYSKAPDVLVIARVLWAGKWKIALATALALGLAAAHIYTTEPVYVASTILSLESPAQTVNFEKSSGSPAAAEKKFATEAEVLQSRGLAEQLVRRLSLVDDPEFNPELLPPAFPSLDWLREKLRGDEPVPELDPKEVFSSTVDATLGAISVHMIPNTYLVEVYVSSDSPDKSADMANTLALLYIQSRRDLDLQSNSRGVEWLTKKVGELKAAVESADRKVKGFNSSAEVMSPEMLQAQNEQLKALRERYLHSQEKIKLADSRVTLLEDLIKDPSTVGAVAADPVLSEALGLEGVAALPSSVDDDALRRVLAKTRAEADREKRLAETTSAAIADLKARVGRQSDEMVHLQQLEREVQANTAVYEFALNRLKQLSVERGVEQPSVRILSQAEPPLGPSGPHAAVVMTLAAVVGFVFGAGAILVRQGVQDAFRTADEIERMTGIQVLGQVLELPTHRRRRVMKHIMSADPTPFSESVRNLRASILAITGTQRIVILLTSAMPGEGKTTLALGLARSLSAIGKSVLVIDADLRRRALGRHFTGRKRVPGLLSAIVDRKPLSELVINSEELDVDVLPSEVSRYNPADLFSLPDFRRVLGEAKRKYQITIIDTPPTLLVSDAKLIARHADVLLMAVRWNHTTKWQLTDAVREIQMANCGVNGFVMSRMDPRGMIKYGYGDRRGLRAGYRGGYYG